MNELEGKIGKGGEELKIKQISQGMSAKTRERVLRSLLRCTMDRQ